ncbi:MAG TPA: glycosyltransferase [Terracidiphilus sp.]|nr:glycosyltransferase [Terracidiphilus sp.]
MRAEKGQISESMNHTSLYDPTAECGSTNPMEADYVPDRPRLKVLVSAYACSPSRGSEYGVGWGWVEAISKYHDLWVLTAAHSKDDIEAELLRRPELQSKLRFHYIPKRRFFLDDVNGSPTHLYNYKHHWQRAAYEVGKTLHEQIRFDIVHQLTYVGFRVPGFLWQLDAPFVWGPIGGLEQTTWALIPSLGLRGGLHFLARNLLNERDRRFSRAPKLAFTKADGGIIAATTGIQKEISRFYAHDSTVISEIGLPPVTRQTPIQRLPAEPLCLLWCGNLIPLKALPFLLSALQMLPVDLNWRLTIIGSGPCSVKWRRLARINGVADRCDWIGQVPRQTVLQKMQTAHVLVITSVHDLTSTVLVEALANGLPVICPDHCGFTNAITDECGIKVPALSRRGIIAGLCDAIVRLSDENVRLRIAEGALRRSAEYDWDLKAKAVSNIYFRKSAYSRNCGPKPILTMNGTD